MFSALLGNIGDFGDGGHAADSGDAGGDAGEGHGDYGVEGHGHGDTHTGAASAAVFHYPFFSPLALSTLFASLGAYGLIAKYGLRVADGASFLLALPAALLTAYAVTYLGWRIVLSSRGSSQIRLSDLAGATAEVTTPIPAGGLGEVAAMVKGQRYSAPARAADGGAVPRGAVVTVQQMLGTTLVVTPAGETKGGK